MKKWTPLILLAVAQFVMILDSTVMNVSISTVAKDLGTTITGMQAAITLYALTMAAFMLIGGKLGDIWGRSRAFVIGLVVYGIGSLITAISPTLPVLLFGWSLVEGLGAILVIPAIAALTAVNYAGKDRLRAFAVIGAVTGLAAAFGPVIGGFFTTYLSWRYVFATETVIMVIVFLLSGRIADAKAKKAPSIDIPSAFLSAAGMTFIVLGALQSRTWGWIRPLNGPSINGVEIAPFGISLVAYFILIGGLLLYLFIARQRKLEAEGKNPLLTASLLRLPVLRSGLAVLMAQYFAIAAIFFVIPVYLQTMLGFNALDTGLRLLPLSFGLIIFTMIGSRLTASRGPRKVVRFGQLSLALGSLFLLASITPSLDAATFFIGLFVVGAGFGFLASQIGNVNMSAVPKGNTSEVGGLQGTYQNLGTSFGTALAGSVFLLALSSSFTSAISSSSVDPAVKDAIAAKTAEGVPILSPSVVESLLASNGASGSDAQQVGDIYESAQIEALRTAMFAVFALSLVALVASRNIPMLDK